MSGPSAGRPGRRPEVRPSRRPALDRYAAAVLQTLRRRRLTDHQLPILVAASGGPDSTALLGALAELRAAGEVGPLSALHVDHGLRAGVAEEASACAEACRALGIPFRSVEVQVAAGNVQAEARRARYAALRAEATRVGALRIATGHTRTDQAETVLLRLLRGAGARGLAGIPPRRGTLIRPLLDRPRHEGLAYLARRGLPWRDDPSNATPRYARNRLRQRVWPLLLELNPSAEAAMARAADLLRDDERALARRARSLIGGGRAPLGLLAAEPRAVRRRVVRQLAGRGAPAPEAIHVEAVLALVRRGLPGRTGLPGGRVAEVVGDALRIGSGVRRTAAPVLPVEVPGPGRYLVPPLRLEVVVSAAPGCLVDWPLLLRTRRPGDRFRPAGGRGGKKLKAWLIDRKVPRARRERLVLLAGRDGAVLAIPQLGARSALLPDGLSVGIEPRR